MRVYCDGIERRRRVYRAVNRDFFNTYDLSLDDYCLLSDFYDRKWS